MARPESSKGVLALQNITPSTNGNFRVARPESSKGVLALQKITPFEDSGRATQLEMPPALGEIGAVGCRGRAAFDAGLISWRIQLMAAEKLLQTKKPAATAQERGMTKI